MSDNSIKTSIYHYSDFSDIKKLVEQKEKRNLSISLCFPTLNEEKTIGKEICILKSELMIRYPLIDEMIVIDSGSTDQTRKIARELGAEVYQDKEILPDLKEQYKGKGENLWKALYITKGDIILYIDADIRNIHERFGYGLLGPLIMNEKIKFSKAFYERPIVTGDGKVQPTGGGRVTELVTKPLFSLFTPELTEIIQPLSGEYGGFREIFERIPFPVGYGIETSMAMDIWENWGLDVIAQVDLEKRVHDNQTISSLGKMAFALMKTFLHRAEQRGLIDLKTQLEDEMIRYNRKQDGGYEKEVLPIKMVQRPPIIELPEYRKKFNITD